MADSDKSSKITLLQEAECENTPQARLKELAKINVELARVVAKNPSAAPELLQKLGNSEDKETRQNVAQNPNAPTDLLFKLGIEFPQELFDNPVLSLLLLENPNLIQEMPVETLVKLLELDTIPTDWMVMAANRNSKNDYPVLETLVKSLRTPASALSKLLKIEDSVNKIGDTIALSAQMHVNYAGEITEGWEEAAKKSISECELYCHDDSVFELWKFGTIPEFLLGALSHQVKLEIVDDLTTPARTLEILAKNTHSDSILTKLAGNPNTPLSTIDKLATTYNQIDFTAFIYNPTIPLSLLQKYCQQKFTAKLTNLIELQKNRNLNLTNLLEDKDNHVRLAAIQNYQENTDKYLINSDKLLDNWQALQNPKISESQLVRLAKHKNAIIREAVALHPKTPVDILAKLANDKHVAVRIGAAQNPNTPVDIIEKLAQTKTKKFQAAKTAAIKFLVSNYPEKASLYLQTYINTPTPSFSRFIGLLYVGANSNFLANNSDSPSYLERYAIAQHPNTPQGILRKLINDPNRIVRAAAKANLLH